MKVLGLVAVVGAVAFIGNANAQDQCSSYVGQIVAPRSFDAVAASLSKIPTKGEFETTAAYEARKAAAIGANSNNHIITNTPEDRAAFAYDADSQKLRILDKAFGYDIGNIGMKFITSDSKIKYSTRNLDVTISETERPVGTYIGSNSFGAKARITKVDRVTKGIFDGEAPSRFSDFAANYLFATTGQNKDVVGELALSPSEAQALKPTLKLAFVVTPKDPFLIQGSHSVGETTIADPVDITNRFSILIADIQCGLVMNATNKVLAAYPTKSASVSGSTELQGSDPLRPVMRTHTLPPYPPLSVRLNEQGTTLMQVQITTEGTVEDCKVINSSSSERLDTAACEYVKRVWRWQPPTNNGQPVAARTMATVVWDLKNAH